MSPAFPFSRLPEDLSDDDVEYLRRLGFLAAVAGLGWSAPRGGSKKSLLDYLEEFVEQAGVIEPNEKRYAVAQAAAFISNPATMADYIPSRGLEDDDWLRFVIRELGLSDIDLAFKLARHRGESGAPDVEQVARARERLGLLPNNQSDDADTLEIMCSTPPEQLSAQSFLKNKTWMEARVKRRWSDGRIAKELLRIGYPCDRSTVRLYRKEHGLPPGTELDDDETE